MTLLFITTAKPAVRPARGRLDRRARRAYFRSGRNRSVVCGIVVNADTVIDIAVVVSLVFTALMFVTALIAWRSDRR
jgi:hypothetical protein